MRQRLWYLLRVNILLLLIFMVAKMLFMFFNHEGHDFTTGDVCDVLRHGLSLDFSTSLYLMIVPFLTTLVSVWWNKTVVLRRILLGYYVIIALALALAFVADTSLYPFWGFKLDASCLQFLSTPGDAFASVSIGYLLVRLVGLIVLVGLIGWSLYRIKPLFRNCRHPWLTTLLFLLLIPLMVIGIRGGTDESTTNIGQVYYSQNQFLNHAAVNPVFSFLSSFEKTANHIVDYDYIDSKECETLMRQLYPTTSTGNDTLLTTTRPNVVIVLMESAGDVFSKAMPNLQRLKEEGIDFTNCYGNTWRTDRGTVCTYSGYPSFPTSSVMKMPQKTNHLPSIASALQQEGYKTSYLYGGDINFTNMRSYLIATGWEQLTWKADYTGEEQRTAEWGVRDDITFNTLYNQILAINAEKDTTQRFLFGFSTLSSHEPWDVPMQQLKEEIPNAFYYLDHCIGEFISKLKQSPQWKNLLVIFLPDHSIDYGGMTEAMQQRNKIPMVWVGGAVKGPRKVTKYCNQTDLAATLLAQMQLPHQQFRWSRDVLSSSYSYPFIVHNYNNGFSVADSTGFVVYDLDSKRLLTNESRDATRLERMGKAILQGTTSDLKQLDKSN